MNWIMSRSSVRSVGEQRTHFNSIIFRNGGQFSLC